MCVCTCGYFVCAWTKIKNISTFENADKNHFKNSLESKWTVETSNGNENKFYSFFSFSFLCKIKCGAYFIWDLFTKSIFNVDTFYFPISFQCFLTSKIAYCLRIKKKYCSQFTYFRFSQNTIEYRINNSMHRFFSFVTL